jgi:hypothetical protein
LMLYHAKCHTWNNLVLILEMVNFIRKWKMKNTLIY